MKYFKLIFICLLIMIVMGSCADNDQDNSVGVVIGGDSTSNALHNVTPKLTCNVDSCAVSFVDKGDGNIEVLATEDDHHIFVGWYLGENLLISKDILTIINLNTATYKGYIENNTLVIKARFVEAAKINFNLDGGTAPSLKTKYNTSEGEVDLPYTEVFKSGYIFTGWEDEKGNVLTSLPAGTVGNIQLKAVWVKRIDESIINSVWRGDLEVTFMEELLLMDGITSSVIVHFMQNEQASIYSNLDGQYVDIGILYTQYIHNFERLHKIRLQSSDSSKTNLYNKWDHTPPRYEGRIGFRYEIEEDHIYLFLSSDDEEYSDYIEKYFSWPIYTFQYDNESIYFLPYEFAYGEDTFMEVLKMYFDLFNGEKPENVPYNITYDKNRNECKNITSEWKDIHVACDMSIEEIGNRIFVHEGGMLSYLSNSNFLSPDLWGDYDSNQKIYKITSLTSIRDRIFFAPFIVNKDNTYRVYFFCVLNGCVFDIAIRSDEGNEFKLYYFNVIPDGASIIFFNEKTKEFNLAMYEYKRVYSTQSDWAANNYWGFYDYDFGRESQK